MVGFIEVARRAEAVFYVYLLDPQPPPRVYHFDVFCFVFIQKKNPLLRIRLLYHQNNSQIFLSLVF